MSVVSSFTGAAAERGRPLELILIRHGLPVHRETEDGTPANPALSEIGLDQAQRVAAGLHDLQIDRLYSSPMERALQTAIPLSKQKGLEIEVCDGVAEYDQNAVQYIPVEKLKEIDYEAWRRLMSGEVQADFDDFASTVVRSLEEIVRENKGRRVAVTCHGGVINVWAAHVMGFDPRLFFNPNYTSRNVFMAASSGEKSVITLNDFSHLK